MSNFDKIAGFKELIRKTLVPKIDSDYVLLDLPNHSNIGDNLIWEGELQFLKEIKYKCIYSANVHNWEEDKIQDAKIILFHGGGNWGDLYRECQVLRMYIVNKYPNKRIIVFPQTVWYNNESLLKEDCDIINKHNDLHICVRDKHSLEILGKYVDKNKLYLLPDMAFFLDVKHNAPSTSKTLYMLRKDTEVCNRSVEINCCNDIKDWPTFNNNKYVLYASRVLFMYNIKLSKFMQRTSVLKCFVDPTYGINRRNNRERYITMGINFFSKYTTIYTTRLHGLILGIIMQKHMIIVDNKYNKCRDFYDTWLQDFDNVSFFPPESN